MILFGRGAKQAGLSDSCVKKLKRPCEMPPEGNRRSGAFGSDFRRQCGPVDDQLVTHCVKCLPADSSGAARAKKHPFCRHYADYGFAFLGLRNEFVENMAEYLSAIPAILTRAFLGEGPTVYGFRILMCFRNFMRRFSFSANRRRLRQPSLRTHSRELRRQPVHYHASTF